MKMETAAIIFMFVAVGLAVIKWLASMVRDFWNDIRHPFSGTTSSRSYPPTWNVTIRWEGSRQQVQLQATTRQAARTMVEAQYGKGSVISIMES